LSAAFAKNEAEQPRLLSTQPSAFQSYASFFEVCVLGRIRACLIAIEQSCKLTSAVSWKIQQDVPLSRWPHPQHLR